MLSKFKRAINIKYFMVGYLAVLLIVSAVGMDQPLWLFKIAVIILVYSGFDLAWTKVRDHVWYLPVSSWISGCVLSIVAIPDPPWLFVVLLPLIAVASKQLLHFGKPRHIFNPAAFSILILGFFTPMAAWWATVGISPWVILLVGLFILWRQARWQTAIAFIVSYVVLTISWLLLTFNAATPEAIAGVIPALFAGNLLFFMTVMLIEPITTGFATTRQKMIFGLIVGVIAGLVTPFVGWIPQLNLDPLIVGLLAGNLICSLLFVATA